MQIKDSPYNHRRGNSMDINFENGSVLNSYRKDVAIINPYNKKDASLGNSIIEHNPILNPVPDYKHNKYIYKNDNSLKNAGNSMMMY